VIKLQLFAGIFIFLETPFPVQFIFRPKAFGRMVDLLYGPKTGLHVCGYNSTESEPIWLKFGRLWAKCWRLALADLGAIGIVATVWEGAEIFFIMRITHGFADFPSDKFYDILTQKRRSVSPCKRSEQNFENFYHEGSFLQKNAKIA